jgi:hypothetical protein
MNKYIHSKKFDFRLFNIEYTNDENKCIEKYVLEKSKTYQHMGSLDSLNGLNNFLSQIGSNKTVIINKMEKIIIRLLKKVLLGYEMEYFWLSIRVTMPNTHYDLPRWHKDGKFFINSNMESSKFVTVLKGPGTLLIKSNKKNNKTYKTIYTKMRKEQDKYPYNIEDTKEQQDVNLKQQHNISNNYRHIFADKFKNEKIIQVKNNEGLIFFTSDNDNNGAIHSEPKLSTPRMFISILPGTKENIEELKQRWE